MKFKVLEIKDLPDGGAEIVFNLDSETQTELKKTLGMKDWDDKKFQQFVVNSLTKELQVKFTTSTLAEVNLEEFEDDLNNDGDIHHWLVNFCTFQHTEAYEFIHHLFLDESEEWFIENVLNTAPQVLHSVMLNARENGAARICFYL